MCVKRENQKRGKERGGEQGRERPSEALPPSKDLRTQQQANHERRINEGKPQEPKQCNTIAERGTTVGGHMKTNLSGSGLRESGENRKDITRFAEKASSQHCSHWRGRKSSPHRRDPASGLVVPPFLHQKLSLKIARSLLQRGLYRMQRRFGGDHELQEK
jgi:hypothetical protein